MSEEGDANAAPTVHNLVIAPEEAGQRIDNFLRCRLKGLPKTHIYRIVRKGEVRVNSARVRADYRLGAGDRVRVPPLRLARPDGAVAAGRAARVLIEASVRYEDGHVVVLDKPAGMPVHGGSGLRYGVIEALRASRPQAPFLELVHRLDRDTSGCLLVAKRRSALRALHLALREGRVEKRYLALVRGRWPRGRDRVLAPLRKNVLRSGERVVRVDPEGKAAESRFRVQRALAVATLMEVTLVTGRTHQIRVHAAHAGCPVAGDEKYGDEEFNAYLRGMGLRRLFLHARAIAFDTPWEGGRTLRVKTPLERRLQGVLERLEGEARRRSESA